ncbi:PH domain-containing protein [Chloroflexus sp.]|uniref:PH domain-containing protein n=1 Tax=Chloroflexus sp. TaxID=1904827 RepID=UPI00260300FF|nr:PH domain-containing protein [uncultured Chloroflexus sp.]
MAILHQYPPNIFRRHPSRRLPHYAALAALFGASLAFAFQAMKSRYEELAIGLTFGSILCLLAILLLAWQESRFMLIITRHSLIIDEGFPFGPRCTIERIYVRRHRCLPGIVSWLTDSGTLEIEFGDETIVLTGLTPFRALRDALEVS